MPQKNQFIGCSVTSCVHYKKENQCSLEQIQVAPCSQCNDGSPEHETSCASYNRKA